METRVETIPLWSKDVPQSRLDPDYREALVRPWGADCLSCISAPRVIFYPASNKPETRPTVLICPGGGYEVISHVNEGHEVAAWLKRLGLNAAILLYRLPSAAIMDEPSLGPLQDAREALRLVRQRLAKPGIPQQPCGIMGFSAGGHLAALLSVHWDKDVNDQDASSAPEFPCRPDFSLLIYPVISMHAGLGHAGSVSRLLGARPSDRHTHWFSAQTQVSSTSPTAFLVHSTNDGAVPWHNSLAYFEALQAQGVPAEMHLYPDGGHGYGLAGANHPDFQPAKNGQASFCAWTSACEAWLASRGLVHHLTGQSGQKTGG